MNIQILPIITPIEIVSRKDISMTEKLLLSQIFSFNINGECFANNSFFANTLGVDKSTITRAISSLKKLGFIEVIHKIGCKRFITVNGLINKIPALKKLLKKHEDNTLCNLHTPEKSECEIEILEESSVDADSNKTSEYMQISTYPMQNAPHIINNINNKLINNKKEINKEKNALDKIIECITNFTTNRQLSSKTIRMVLEMIVKTINSLIKNNESMSNNYNITSSKKCQQNNFYNNKSYFNRNYTNDYGKRKWQNEVYETSYDIDLYESQYMLI